MRSGGRKNSGASVRPGPRRGEIGEARHVLLPESSQAHSGFRVIGPVTIQWALGPRASVMLPDRRARTFNVVSFFMLEGPDFIREHKGLRAAATYESPRAGLATNPHFRTRPRKRADPR